MTTSVLGQGRMQVACLALALAGCTYSNRQLNTPEAQPEKMVKNHTRAALARDWSSAPSETLPDQDGYFVGLAISGGGSRSAVFGAACMFELQRLGLLQKVDYISAVSGGSLAGAYYCLNDTEWNPGNVQRKLTHSFASDMICQMLMPWNLLGVMFTDLDRSDLLANSLRQNLFWRDGHELRYKDLRKDRPHLLLNATDLQSGRPFVFCNESFDEINSDLSEFPVAYAVAASSAVPVVMHQVTLRDFSTIFKQYKHLIDGGISDNLGITTLVETYNAQIEAARRANRPSPYPHGAVFLVLDALTQFDAQIADKGDTGILESLQASAGLTATALVNRASSASLSDIIVRYSPDEVTAEQLRGQIKELADHGMLDLHDHDHRPVRVVHLSLSRVSELRNQPFRSFGEKVNGIATYFAIEPTEAYHLQKAAELLVQEQFQERLEEIARQLSSDGAQ